MSGREALEAVRLEESLLESTSLVCQNERRSLRSHHTIERRQEWSVQRRSVEQVRAHDNIEVHRSESRDLSTNAPSEFGDRYAVMGA